MQCETKPNQTKGNKWTNSIHLTQTQQMMQVWMQPKSPEMILDVVRALLSTPPNPNLINCKPFRFLTDTILKKAEQMMYLQQQVNPIWIIKLILIMPTVTSVQNF